MVNMALLLWQKEYIDGIMPEERMCQNEIFQESVSKFFEYFAVFIITSLRSYLKLQNATQHEMNAFFDSTIYSPKFSFILILWFIRPFGIGVFALLSSTIHEQPIQRWWYVNVSHLPYFGAYTLSCK